MNGLERVIEENDMLLFLSPTGGIRALGINDFSFMEAEKGFRKDNEACLLYTSDAADEL